MSSSSALAQEARFICRLHTSTQKQISNLEFSAAQFRCSSNELTGSISKAAFKDIQSTIIRNHKAALAREKQVQQDGGSRHSRRKGDSQLATVPPELEMVPPQLVLAMGAPLLPSLLLVTVWPPVA